MRSNSSFDAGNLILLREVNKRYKLFDFLFDSLAGKTKHLKQSAKLFVYNKLGKCVSVNRLIELYQEELFECLGFAQLPAERTVYRDLERIGDKSNFIIDRYQTFAKDKGFITNEQFIDFSSSFFEGNKAELGELGFSRDNQPGKKQVVFGISTGTNDIPSALTIQKGNV